MRSVVVVLPASIWAMIPMLRILSMLTFRCVSFFSAMFGSLPFLPRKKTDFDLPCEACHLRTDLPAEMGECLIGICHLVCGYFSLECRSFTIRGVNQLGGELL